MEVFVDVDVMEVDALMKNSKAYVFGAEDCDN